MISKQVTFGHRNIPCVTSRYEAVFPCGTIFGTFYGLWNIYSPFRHNYQKVCPRRSNTGSSYGIPKQVVQRYYQNPVVTFNLPDPGVLKLPDGAGFVMVGTSDNAKRGDDAFPILFSTDLVNWTHVSNKVCLNGCRILCRSKLPQSRIHEG